MTVPVRVGEKVVEGLRFQPAAPERVRELSRQFGHSRRSRAWRCPPPRPGPVPRPLLLSLTPPTPIAPAIGARGVTCELVQGELAVAPFADFAKCSLVENYVRSRGHDPSPPLASMIAALACAFAPYEDEKGPLTTSASLSARVIPIRLYLSSRCCGVASRST